MGFMGVCLVLFPLSYLIRPCLSCCDSNRKVSKIRSKLRVSLYWSVPLRFIIETYIIIVLCSLINFQRLESSSLWDLINSTLSYVAFVVAIAVPIIIALALHKRKNQLNNKAFKSRFSTVYSEMRTNIEGNGLIKVVTYYYFRRIVLAATVVMLGHVLVIQFFIFVM